MLTLKPGDSRELTLPELDGGTLQGKPTWRTWPPDVLSVVVHGDGLTAVVTAGQRPGRVAHVFAEARWKTDDGLMSAMQSMAVAVAGEDVKFGALKAAPKGGQRDASEPEDDEEE
jgi:hypothetical protein